MSNIRALYDALEGTIDNRGTYEEFEKRMQNEANRKVLYDTVKDDFNNLGTYEEYSARLGYGKESADATSQQNSSVAQEREEKKPVQEITPSDAGRLNVLPDGAVAEEGFNQSTLVETDADWHSNTEQRLAKQNEEDFLDAVTADMDKGQAAWLKSEYYKSKAQGKIDSINKFREEHDVDRKWGKEGIKQAKEDIKAAQTEIDNNPYYINYLNERTAQFDSQIANIDYLTNEVAKKYGQQKPLLVDPENLVPAKPSYGVEGDEKMSQLQAARNFTQQARDITAAPLRYAKGDDWLGNRWAEMVSAGKGIGDILSDRTFWDVQMTQQDNLTLLNAIKKVEKATGRADELGKRAAEGDFTGILSDEEQAMLSSYLELQGARAERANNTARMYNVGKGAVQTAEFMLEMALTAPIGTPIQQATTKAVGKFLFKQTAKMATDTFLQKGLKYGATKGARVIAGQAGNLLSSMVRVPFHWTTGDAISERALEVGEDGKLATPLEAYVGGFMDTYKETATEGMGKATMEAIGSALKVTGVSNILDVVAKTKPGAFAGKVYRNFTNSKFAKATGYDGFGEEFLEEFDGAVWERLAGNPDALKDFTQVDNLLTTVGTLVPMAVIGGSTTVAQLSFAEKKMKSANELLATEMKRQGYEQDQIDYYLDVLRTATPKQMSEILSHVVTDTKLEGAYGAVKPSAAEMMSFDTQALAMYNAVKNAMVANIRYTSLNGTYQAQQDQQREDKKAELEEKYGTFYQTRTATNEKTGQTWEAPSIVETATLNDGRNVFINSAASEGGQIAATDSEGNHIFINESDIATRVDKDGNAYQLRTKQSLDGYLSYLIMQKEQAEEATRMETEVAEQTESIAAEYAMGAEVTLGTPEAPIKGKVVEYLSEGNGVKIETEDGQFIEKTYDELANEKGTPIQPRTNQQIIDEEVEQLNLDEQLYAKLQDYYKSYGKFWSDPRVEEDGTTSMPFVGVVETADGKFVILSQGQNEGEIIALSQTGEKVVINETDVTKRAALPLSSFLKNEEFAPTAKSAEEQVTPTAQPVSQSVNEDANEGVVEEIDEEQLPQKPDGSVDETALWNNSPAAWAKWNDQRRQDGGADSLNYINKAIERERTTLAQLIEARDNELDFDKRDAIEQQMQDIRFRLATLYDLQQQYESTQNEVQQKYQSTQETQSQTQNKSDIIMAYSPDMEEKDLANLDATYNLIYTQTKSPSEKVRVLQEYLDVISKGTTPVKVLTKDNYEQVMRESGCTDAQIEDIRIMMQSLDPGQGIAGFQASGCCFVMAEGNPNIDAARSAYVHERQHILSNSDMRYVAALVHTLGNKENALALLEKLSDAKTASRYARRSVAGIANEIISRCMEVAYKYQNFSVDLQNKGVPAQVITLIEKLDNEQRNTPNLSLARRYDYVDEPRYENNRQDERDRGEVSRGVLGEQGLRASEASERGVGDREEGAGVEESAVVDPTENIINRGADFRITKTPDSNGLSYEQTDEIEKTAGELEYGDDESAATQFSIVAIAEGVGLNVVKDDGEGNVAFVAPNGKTFDANNPITAEDLKSIPDTPFGYMMADAKAIGNVSPSKEWMLWKKYALMLNAFLKKGSAENGGIENLQGTWQFIADTVYKTVATNSDSQYSYSLDITRVCKKNEAVINAISEMQRRLGYGITPGQIMDIYLSTIEAGYQVPCPVCYVFSRYIRNGKYATIMINGQRKYGSQLVNPRTLTEEQKKERIAYWLAEKERIEAENEANKSAIAKANEDITILLKEIDALSKQITDPKSNLSEEQKAEMLEKIHAMDARYRAALNVVSQSSLDSWITQFAIYQKKVDGKMQWFLYEDTYKGFPDEAALDMRMTSTAMRLYPAIQRYRNSRGSGAGKEITFVSNNDIGDVPMALGSDAATKNLARPRDISDEEWEEMKKNDEYADLKLGEKNLYRQAAEEKDSKKKAALLKKARERFESASKYAKQQSLRGGQRMWSWSDNIERLAPDVFINLMQTEMLGGALQSYSKQLEGIKLVASMNGYVNGSLMGKGNGYREVSEDEIETIDGKTYVKDADFVIAEPGKAPIILKSPAYKHTDGRWYTLEFDGVVGIDAFGKDIDGHHFKGLFDLNAQYDKAGNILVGMNDLHIRMAMMDDRIFFIIPWHSSGANQHILAQMYDYLGVEYDVKESQDYTDVQGEKRYKAFGETSEEKETKDGKKKEEAKITEHLINFWVDHYENAREIASYGKVAGKDFDCGIEGGIENSDGNGFISASQAHYRELRDAIFNGVKVQTGVDKKGKPTYTNMNVEDANPEWFNEIMNDEFLRQVFNKVRSSLGEDGRMTSGDSKSIYPYEYWDEKSTFDTADINGVRYLEYCRRLGYKPKFCGKLDGKPAKDFGNFADDKGYWKTLIDRRMYGVDKTFQDLTPVTAENFTTDLVDPEATAKEFIVTTVADERGTQTIVDSALAKEESRGGVATVDYDLSMQEALDAYNGVDYKITEENFPEVSEKVIADMQKEIKDVQFSIIGEVAALRDKSSEGVQRLNNLAVARDMESQLEPDWSSRDNVEALKIKVATGWERGADGLWRYEVEDPKLRNPEEWLNTRKKLTLKDIVGDGELLRLYPTLGDINIKKMTGKSNWDAAYIAGENTIELPFGTLKALIKAYEYTDEETRQRKIDSAFLTFYTDLVHEMQHAIQHREGFARGGSPETILVDSVRERLKELSEEHAQLLSVWNGLPKAQQVWSNPVASNLIRKAQILTDEVRHLRRTYRIGDGGYRRLAGEVESKNVEKRILYTLEERRQLLLSATEDVNRADQLLIFNDVLAEKNGEDVQFSIRTDEQKEKLFDAAKAHYGVTNNFNAAGYMLPDGSLLDYSEANDGGDPNQRSLDHRDIEGIIMDEGTEYESRWMYIADFLNEGAIRLLPESAGINLSVAPTAEQRSRLFDFIYKYRGEVILEISDDRMNSVAYVEYNRGTAPARIFRDIDGYFNDGIVPQQDVQFKVANNNQRIFVSNAAKAVEGIQMGKATPEQWLKMIEKNGGLKAGEDKWMGLSDWLKSSDKKTLTKQEVLDFINENMIQIEEVHYDAYAEESASDTHSNIVGVLQNKFNDYVAEYHEEHGYEDEYDDPASKYAIEKLREEMEDTFPYTIELVYGNEVYVTFDYEEEDEMVKWAEKTGVDYMPEQSPINETRLQYTTDGLENKHEIALTVPTVESWGADDAIHFGDAGDGRAVAWIRFGDAMVYPSDIAKQIEAINEEIINYPGSVLDEEYKSIVARKTELRKQNKTNRVLVIDEIQSKRHQEGREKGYARGPKVSLTELRQKAQDFEQEMIDKYHPEDLGLVSFASAMRGVWTEEESNTYSEMMSALGGAAMKNIGIPDAPFDKNWHELAMKRMLRYAAENGYDAIAWTKGDQQAERYSLGKVYNEIEREDNPNIAGRTFSFSGRNYDKVTVNEDGVVVDSTIEEAKGKPLSGLVGKDLAVKMMSLENYDTIDGEELRIGGEGMKGFYDKMLPSFMNKYGKKWGIKVSDMELPNLENGLTMHSIPVTEEMKQSVMEEGQVMFKIRGANESPMEFTQEAVEDFTKRFYDVAPIYVVDKFNSKAELAESLEMREQDITDEQYENILDGYKNSGTAFYSKDWSIIVTFANADNSADIEHSLFHESIHKVDMEDISGGNKLGQWLWDNAEKIQDGEIIKDAINNVEDYTEKDYPKEMLAELLSWYMSIGETEILINQLPAEYQKTVKSILSEIRYDSREEDNLRQQPETAYTRAKDAIRKGTKEYGGERTNEKGNELSAEERRQISEYLPGFEEVEFKVNSHGQELTNGQQKFFANSKAVDKDGNLLVLYHGTPRAGFTEFKGGWFTTSKKDAISYSGDRKGRLFDPDEMYEPETLTAGDFRLGYMTFDSEEDRAVFLERFPYADEVMSEREYEDARMGAEDEEYDALTARRKEFAEVWDAYREYERERFVDTTVGDLIANPEAYTEEDLMRAMLEYDSNASFDSLDDMSAEERKDALVSALQNANEETEGGILDMVIPTRVPRNGEGFKHNDLGNRTYEVYANVENPYEIDANGRGSEFESGDIYKAVEETLKDKQYDGIIIRNWRVGRYQELGDVVVPKYGEQIKLTSNESPTGSAGVQFKVVTDPKVIEEFEAGEKAYAWRSAYINEESEVYSPMASRLKPTATGTKQQKNEAAQMGQIDQAVENPDMVDEKGHITILDEDGGKNIVAYNPYDHCCINSMMNDQFKRAWKRDNLFVVRVSYPKSEETSGYHAYKAKDPVGIKTDWKAGAVGQKLPESKRRHIMLTRLMKNLGVEKWEKVANDWIKTLEGENIDVPFNCVPRKVLNFLADAGVNIVAPESGMPEADAAYEEWKKDPIGYVGDTELPPHIKALNESVGFNPDEGVNFKVTGTPTSEVVEKGLQLSLDDFSKLTGNIYESLPENVREDVLEIAARNDWDLQNAIYQIPARLAEKESWTKEDAQLAESIADKVTDAVRASGVEMRRPLTPNEALWMLYQSTNATKEGDLFGAAREAVVANNLGFGEGVQFSITSTDELESIDNIIKDGKMTLSSANQEAADAFAERMGKINGNIAQLRMAAAAQREYDQNTVKAVVNVASALLEKGMLSPSTRREVVRLLNITRDAVGKKDLTITANRLIDLMISNQLRYAQELLDSFLKVRDKKVDARGIEVQGKLDINGQQIMQTLRDAVKLSPEKIDERIAIAENNLDSPSETIKRNAENELVALNLAKQLVEEVKDAKEEESDLRDEIKGSKVLYDEGKISKEEHHQFVKEAREAIRELRLQRLNAMQSLTGNLAKMMKGSIENAERLRAAEKERVEKIHHFANSDMQGMPSDEHTAIEKNNSWWNSGIVRFFLKPLATFDQMLRSFAPKSRSGEGYLWNHFMNGWMKATENEFKGVQAAHETLDAKAREVFGKDVKRWSDIFSIDRDLPSVSVKFWDGGEMKDHKLTQGNLLYIYMVNKMPDGRMKLRKMGITEEDVANIVRNLDPRFIEIADWLQGEFLPSLREKYNALHEKMFGAPMAAIDNYFPIRVLANARVREVDLGVEESNSKPSTITGSIIKRTKNALALDVMGSNAFDVILEHIQDMEHWHAFAEWNRDLNTLLSYKKFRNRVQNMTGIYGAGTTAWNNFRTTAEIAAGVYKPAAKPDSIDKLAVNLAKGVTGAKISFRVYTAIKQLLSMPAFVSDANIATLAKNMATPWVAWNWAMENLPIFEKRWKSRQAGDSRLMQTESDYKIWKTKFVETASRLGMTPNALVDAVTVAIGARSIYETKVKQYIKDGYSQEKAEEKAKRDATILFNESQQSNEGAFLSAVQVDRTAGAVAFSVFRNSAMGYQRMYVDAIRNLGNSMRKGYKEESIEFMKKQMVRDGLTEEQATRAAERIFNRSFVKSAARIATFGFLVQFAWNLGASLPYLLVGGDGDDKEEMIKDAAIRGLVGAPVEGLTAGSVASNIIGNIARGEKISNVSTNLLPVVSDIEKTLKMLDNDWVAASNEMLNILFQAGIGVNPQTFTDVIVAVVDACNGDLETSKEAMLCLMRILQAPQSQVDKVFMDEIGFTEDKGLDMRIEEFAKRYADYKVMRGAPMTGWLYSDEKEKKAEDKYINRFLKTAEEAKRTKGNEEAKEYYEFLDGTYKEMNETLRELRQNIQEANVMGDKHGVAMHQKELRDFMQSDPIKGNKEFYQRTKAIENLKDKSKKVPPSQREKLEDAALRLRKALVERMREEKSEENPDL